MASGLNFLRPLGHRNIRHGSFFSDDVMEEEEVVVALEEENQIRKRGDATAPTTTTAIVGSGPNTAGVDRGWLQLGISDYGRRRDCKDDPKSSSSHSSVKPELDLLGGGGTARRSPLAGFPDLPCVGGRQRLWDHQKPSSSETPSPSTSAWGRSTANLASCGEIRVVRLPRRTQTTALWLVLQAAQEQRKEPFLPQIPKCYLRIKDGRMTIRLMMKYLANKFALDDESEVEISCRGQQLPPSMTLICVRDSIWCSSTEAVGEQQHSNPSTAMYVMNLLYGRSNASCGI